jgi:hypothetical protein
VLEVTFLVNDLSFHGQFSDLNSFRDAIGRLMTIREITRRYGHELHCHKGMVSADVMPGMSMQQAIQTLTLSQQRSLRSWITQNGPFWEDTRNHSADDYLELNGNVVTDTAVGEAAWCRFNGMERELVSLTPSSWLFTLLPVRLMTGSNEQKKTNVVNHWNPSSLEAILKVSPIPITSWQQLAALANARWPLLTFAADSFSFLDGHPFVSSAAQRLLAILDVLNRFKTCFDENGQRTAEGHEIYQNFFTGKKEGGGHGATFSDSSESEKIKFKNELTFKHPDDASKTIFCPWHGKVQTPQLRVHFSWPVRSDEPLYIVYVGQKITKQ